MVVLIILLCVLFLLIASGSILLCISSARPKTPDYWNPKVVRQKGYASLQDTVEAGKQWFLASGHETVTIESPDGLKLCGEVIENPINRGVILLFHGWHSTWKLDFSSVLSVFYEMGFHLIIAEQRCAERSEGRFVTFGVKESGDAAQWTKYAAQRFGSHCPIFLDGISMGASTVLMASELELSGNVKGILADSGFTSAYDEFHYLAKHGHSWVPAKPLLGLMNLFTTVFAGYGLRERNTQDALQNSRYPILLIHGTGDTFVPSEMSIRNYEACRSYKKLVLVEGAGHGMSYIADPERVSAALYEFLAYCENEASA